MQMVQPDKSKKRDLTKRAQKALISKLPKTFFERELYAAAEELQEEFSFSDSTKYRLLSLPKRIPLVWNKKTQGELKAFDPTTVDNLEIIEAWGRQKNCYLSHFSALYFNGLIEQRPVDFYITKEIKNKLAYSSTGKLNEFSVRQAFLKPARHTNNYFSFKTHTYYLLEKIDLGLIGVVKKTIPYGGQSLEVKITSPERTFLDSIISPHYSGGMANILKAYSNTDLNLSALFEFYNVLKPTYPYWQSIGFVLEKLGNSKGAKLWDAKFKNRKTIPFYLEHEAKNYWKLSEKWNLYYPGGLFNESKN
jgi:hypothetical protein